MNENLIANIKRGHVYNVDFGNTPGSSLQGVRPALVIQNDVGNRYSPTVIVAAITETVKQDRRPTHVIIKLYPNPDKDYMLLLENIQTVNKHALKKHLGYVCEASLWPVNRALAISIGVPPHRQKMSEEEKAARREIRATKRKNKKRSTVRMVDAL